MDAVNTINGLGRLIQTQVIGAKVNLSTKDIFVDTWYDEAGQVERQTVPYEYTTGGGWHTRSGTQPYTLRSYDALGRPLSAVNTDGTEQTFTYDQVEEAGVLYMKTCQYDELGHPTCSQSDVWGRVVRSGSFNASLGPDVVYTYDTMDRLVQVDTGGATTSLTYDIAGRKIQMNDPDMGTWSYKYDALGNLVRQTDAKGQRTCLYYDALNRLLGKHYRTDDTCPAYNPEDIPVRYTYDVGANGIGHRTSMNDPSGSASWSYDTRGRLLSESKVISGSGTFVTSYTYNSADLPVTMTYPDNEVLTYTYLNQMLLDKVSSNRKPDGTSATYYLVQDTLYDAAGRVERRDLGAINTTANPVLVSDFHYNAWTVDGGRMDYIKSGIYADQDSLLDLRYDYDTRGNIVSILDVTNSSQKQCYTYDSLNRLTSAAVGLNNSTCSGSVGLGEYADQAYSYNTTSGNLSSKTGLGDYNYDSIQPHAVDSVTGWAYTYDSNGNMTRRDPAGTDYYDYVYDSENRLYQAKKNGIVIATMTYDGDGNRVKSVLGSTSTAFVGGYYEVTAGVITKYYDAGGTRIAMRTGSTFNWLFTDHLSSTSIVATAAGTLQDRILYKAWGEVRSGGTGTRYTYTGQYTYATSGTNDFGLMYYGARWYDPYLNRWIQPDTIIPDQYDSRSYDRYAYVRNNPTNRVDPTGHADEGPGEISSTENLSEEELYNLLVMYAQSIYDSNNGANDLEAMASIVDSASLIYGDDTEGMLKALSAIFLGDPVCGPGSLLKARASDAGPMFSFVDTGFHPDFQDGYNQTYHVWGYIVEAASPSNPLLGLVGQFSGQAANYIHEFQPGTKGTSWQDFMLSNAGMYIGNQISTGNISSSELGNLLRDLLGPNAPASLTSTGQTSWNFIERMLLDK